MEWKVDYFNKNEYLEWYETHSLSDCKGEEFHLLKFKDNSKDLLNQEYVYRVSSGYKTSKILKGYKSHYKIERHSESNSIISNDLNVMMEVLEEIKQQYKESINN